MLRRGCRLCVLEDIDLVWPRASALVTDFYQLSMLQGYYDQGMDQTAVFEFFARNLPASRRFLMAAGLEQVLEFLETFCFTSQELEWLDRSGKFKKDFVDSLEGFRFSGNVDAMPEGTPFFASEPILRVEAPMSQAQLVETRIVNLLQYQTLVASKAARMVLTAPGKTLIDYGCRRAHGAESGLLAARASYLAGFDGTATVLAGSLFGVPVFGTMAHSFIQAHKNEMQAFENFARSHPENIVLLLDTYDTEEAAKMTVKLASRLKQEGIAIKGVRLDSGDLAETARSVRRILDEAGLREIRVIASGNLDEFALRDFAVRQAPIDGFGIGSRLTTSADVPYLDCVYKLQEYAGRPCRKRSEGKSTWPGRKQVYRRRDDAGRMTEDWLTLEEERRDGDPLLQPVMRKGRRLAPPVPLSQSRQRAAQELSRLPDALKSLEPGAVFPVKLSSHLRELADKVDRF
ncbi:MAG: nicotinate phosphoribosyltransferase [Nitrospinales bacterium]